MPRLSSYTAISMCFIIYFGGPVHSQGILQGKLVTDSASTKYISLRMGADADYLKRLIAVSPDDTQKVKNLIRLAGLLWLSDTNITCKAKNLSERLHYYQGISAAYLQMAAWHEDHNNFTAALSFCLRAIAVDEEHHNYPEIFEHYAGALNIYFYWGDFPAAMQLTMRGLALAEKNGNTAVTAGYNSLLGFIYLHEGDLKESKKYYSRYLSLCLQVKDSLKIADAWNCNGDVYTAAQQYRPAVNCFFKAFSIYNNKTNFEWRNDPFGLVQKARVAYTFNKISNACKLNGDYEKALHYSDSVFAYVSMPGTNKYDLAAYYINTGEIYKKLGIYNKALPVLYKGLELSLQIRHREDLRDAYAALAETYAALHRYDSAYLFTTLFTQLKDSIINEQSRRRVAEIQSQYDNEKKDAEITRQGLVRNALITAFVICIVMVLLLYSRYMLKQKHNYQLALNRQQNTLYNLVISAEEKERKRIAEDLHDGLGSFLSAAKLSLSGLEEDKHLLPEAQKQKYETASSLLDGAAAELRNISQNLMPAALSKLGLVAALQSLFGRVSLTGPNINFTSWDFNERLGEETEITIYRVMLELVNNIIKHAGATEITVQVIRYPVYLNITVEDNGSGFNYQNEAAETKGLGLRNIQSRLEHLKATMAIDSGKGTGTTVIIDIPC